MHKHIPNPSTVQIWFNFWIVLPSGAETGMHCCSNQTHARTITFVLFLYIMHYTRHVLHFKSLEWQDSLSSESSIILFRAVSI